MDDYEMGESVGPSEYLDRLSELPTSLFLHILSLLPLRDAISTTLASKGLENLWTTLPCLNFSKVTDEPAEELDCHRLRNFINRALICWKGTKLLKFTFDINNNFNKSLVGDMNLWVRFAVDNKVQELNIGLMYHQDVLQWEEAEVAERSKKDVYWAPLCLYSCSSLRKLSLVGCNLRIHGYPAWNQLESLQIDGFCFSEHLINQIFLGTPQLKVFELRFIDTSENLNISSTSLKTLKIQKYLYYDVEERPSLGTMLRICCPNLETLEISGVYYTKCLFTNVSSLTDATLDFDDSNLSDDDDVFESKYYDARWIELIGESMRHIFSTFQHVERVTLSSSSFQMIGASQKKKLFSPLPNVVFLKVEVDLLELVDMVHLLEIFPNLKMLVIEDYIRYRSPDINAEAHLEFETNVSKCFLLQLKVVDITSQLKYPSMIRCIKFLLKHCSMLEKLVIHAKGLLSRGRLLKVAERLLSMPRSSPTAEVILSY